MVSANREMVVYCFDTLVAPAIDDGQQSEKIILMDELLKNQIYPTHAVAAAGSVIFSIAITYPLDTIKTLFQVGSGLSGPSKQLSITQVVERVRSLSGISGFYSGFGWLASGRVFGVGARFVTYEILTAFCKDGREDNYVYINEALLAGMVAGASESLVITPFELIKLRGQVALACGPGLTSSFGGERSFTSTNAKFLHGYRPDQKILSHSVGLLSVLPTKHHNMTSALLEYPWTMTGSGRPPPVYCVRSPLDVISLEGFSALWRGLRSSVVRDSVFSGIFFSSWQFIHQSMLIWKSIGMKEESRSDEDIGPLSPLSISLGAGFSGCVAAAASHSFDTAKARAQCTVLPKYLTMERKLLKWRRPGNGFERLTGTHPSDRSLLFRGLSLRMARCGLGSFAMVWSYYLLLHNFVQD